MTPSNKAKPLPELSTRQIEKFNRNLDKSGDCWVWTRCIDKRGYGKVGIGPEGSCRTLATHRVAYKLATGKDPGSMHVLHRCDNPPCCNPAHLFLGTDYDNVQDCIAKGRIVKARGETHTKAKLTEKQVLEIRRRYVRWKVTFAILASEYRVTANTIRGIVDRVYWKHI